MKDWNELTRTEKVEHFFEYPEESRTNHARELWGRWAHEYCGRVYFQPDTAWTEIVIIAKQSRRSHSVYLRIKENEFKEVSYEDLSISKVPINEKPTRYQEEAFDDFLCFQSWHTQVLQNPEKQFLADIAWRDDHTLAVNICIQEGDHGDEDGFGVEPSVWVCAVYNEAGNIIQPYYVGYIHSNL